MLGEVSCILLAYSGDVMLDPFYLIKFPWVRVFSLLQVAFGCTLLFFVC